MRPFLLAPVVLAAVSSFPNAALAQETPCPAGDWFCSTDPSPQAESASPPPNESSDSNDWVQRAASAASEAQPPPVVIVIVPGANAEPAPVCQSPAPRTRRVIVPKATPQKISKRASAKKSDEPKSGFDFHLQKLSFFDGQTRGSAVPDASLIGGSAMLRVSARKDLEIHVGNSGLFGKDFHGFERGEIGLSLAAQRHLNPDGRLRFYALAGGVIAFGHVDSPQANRLLPRVSHTGDFYANYGMLSGQFGVGAELRLVSFLSVHVDALASLRWRFAATDDAPEYIDPMTGSARNAYPALMLRSGVTFW